MLIFTGLNVTLVIRKVIDYKRVMQFGIGIDYKIK